MLAQAVTGTPGHINSMARCIMHCLEEYPAETLEPGDVLITNDPWKTSGHHYDITVVTPIFRRSSGSGSSTSSPGDPQSGSGRTGQTGKDAELVAFFGNICHTADFGGRPYGPDGIDVFEEGLEIPIMKLFQAGQPNKDLFRLIRANVRSAEEVVGDLYSQGAADAVGGQRLL